MISANLRKLNDVIKKELGFEIDNTQHRDRDSLA
jgi:hypothetical protein